MEPYTYVAEPAALAAAVTAARREPIVALDTEAASFHRYVDRIYLIQLSTPQGTALVDPLALDDLSPLGALLADPAVEKVFHDADYDLRILDRDYGFRARRLFDTRVAAQLVGEPAVGLAALLEKYCGVKLSKAHQKADWSRRPLPPAMLAYAAADTRHLLDLREVLAARLDALGRRRWAEEEFARLEALRWSGALEADEAYLRLKGARSLRPRQLAALRELYRWREERARAEDKAPFRIIGNEALLAVARALPTTPEALAALPPGELPPALARRHGPALLEAVRRALALAEDRLPAVERGKRPPRDPELDARLERLKAARNRVAASLGLDPGVLCGRATLEAVARARPNDRAGLAAVGELRRWQIEVLGDALLEAL
ncbi:MAG TPA: ribonuclease D [Gemmatimonadales bacterium]|nr:ribonuclease D [Gemmatimonadales bacterium]